MALSVRSWRIRRARPAPSAIRSDSSRSRPDARASMRFATLAHTRRSTKAVVPKRMRIVGRALSTSSSFRFPAFADMPSDAG
ncbi:MAG: hypothetical protein HY049_14140 [Acidobacteria bacterium]|nr:hypothetical protein [Acidobacteriota bacterium]